METIEMREVILEKCKERSDSWANDVRATLLSCIDLVAAGAVYHFDCATKFRNGRPKESVIGSRRKEDDAKLIYFEHTCEWLESNMNLIRLSEAYEYMVKSAGDNEVYTARRFKQKLKTKYEEAITFHETSNQSPIIHFTDLTSKIINDLFNRTRSTNKDDSKSIIKAASKLVLDELRDKKYDRNIYPSSIEVASLEANIENLPSALETFLSSIIKGKLKVASIGQAIIQSVQPRTYISPILLALSASLDSNFGSKWLINVLHKLGFALGYDEVIVHKQSVVKKQDLDSFAMFPFPGHFTQWVADNIDHNIVTLNGEGTFHGMGIISVSTPGIDSALNNEIQQEPLKRLTRVSNAELLDNHGIPIISAPKMRYVLDSLRLRNVEDITRSITSASADNIDLAWYSIGLNSKLRQLRPNWSGFMQSAIQGSFGGAAQSVVLPLIDLKSTDESCIYSTLIFVQSQAGLLNIETPCITFDQPLWQKATEICHVLKLKIV